MFSECSSSSSSSGVDLGGSSRDREVGGESVLLKVVARGDIDSLPYGNAGVGRSRETRESKEGAGKGYTIRYWSHCKRIAVVE